MKDIPIENLKKTIRITESAVKTNQVTIHTFGIVFHANGLDKVVLNKDGTWGLTNND